MKFTFIIVSYNEKEYLEQAIKSCLSQKLDDFEIVIGDDGSNDGSIDLIMKYAEQYPNIIRYSVSDRTGIGSCKDIIASLRVSDVITRALKMARGEYCVVLSGDDYFYEGTFFKNAISFLDRNPDYVTYVGEYEKVWEDHTVHSDQITYPRKLYWAKKYIHLSAFVFRKAVFEKGAFLQRFCDDIGLQYSLAISGKWKYEHVLMFAYRQRNSSIMHEIDRLEFDIVELMIFQDTLCNGKFYIQSMARFGGPLRRVFEQRDKLVNDKYKKYLSNCKKYDCDILKKICDYDHYTGIQKGKFLMWINYTRICGFLYFIMERAYNLVYKCLRACNIN